MQKEKALIGESLVTEDGSVSLTVKRMGFGKSIKQVEFFPMNPGNHHGNFAVAKAGQESVSVNPASSDRSGFVIVAQAWFEDPARIARLTPRTHRPMIDNSWPPANLHRMKMNTMNVSLTPEQSEYVRRNVDRDFGNASEFFRELIRERMRREIDADLKLLASTAKGAPAGPSEQEIEDVLAVQRKVRKELKNARRV